MKRSNDCFSRRNIDILIGGRSIADTTADAVSHLPTVYDYDSIVWCVRHAQLQPIWMNVLHAFNGYDIIIYLAILFYTATFISFIIYMREGLTIDIHESTLLMLQIMLNHPIIYDLKRVTSRYVFVLALVVAIVFYTTFNALYTSNMLARFEKHQVTSVAELIDYDYQLAGNAQTWNAIRDTNIVSNFRTTSHSNRIIFFVSVACTNDRWL